MKLNLIKNLGTKVKISSLGFFIFMFAISGNIPAFAAPTFNEYAISSGYTFPDKIISTPDPNGALWYLERSASGNTDTVAKMTTSGAITDYPISAAGYASIGIGPTTLGSDGNIWFTGCAQVTPTSQSIRVVGNINTSTGVTTAYSYWPYCDTTTSPGGSIAIGPDGNV